MKNILSLIVLALALAGASGCSMCCTPYDYDYAAYGGRWERSDMRHGRVGSAFAPAGAVVTSGYVEEEIIDGQVIVE